MEKEFILTNNKLIAEFMGGITFNNMKRKIPLEVDEMWLPMHGVVKFKNGLKYNTSWDWLMPVVEKIEKDFSYVTITFFETQIWKNNGVAREPQNKIIIWEQGLSKIEGCYLAVIKFIKEYNNGKEKNT